MNIPLLLKVKAAILAEPLKFDMDSFFNRSVTSPCGSTACIAGHAVAITHRWKKLETGVKKFDLVGCGDEAQELLGITFNQRWALFQLYAWPPKYSRAYRMATSSNGRARVAANRITHFIRTNGAE